MKLDNLRAIRKEKKLSRDDLANISGVARATILSLENGINNVEAVKLSTLIRLADALKVKVRELLPDELSNKL